MGEGKLWEKLFGGKKEEISALSDVETSGEESASDLKLLRDRMDDPDGISEVQAMEAVNRLLKQAENNSQIKGELEKYSKEYENHIQGDQEEEPADIKNEEIYKLIREWFEKQRLGKFYYDKNNPRRKLGE